MLLLPWLFLPGDSFAQEYFQARVKRVIDGDSIVVRHRGEHLQVRLWGIDTPEWKQSFSSNAKQYTRKNLDNRIVTIYPKDWDSYGRLVAMVKVEERCINQALIKAGLAWVHIYYCKESICERWRNLEAGARKKGLGLWADTKPVPPWVWKRKHKK